MTDLVSPSTPLGITGGLHVQLGLTRRSVLIVVSLHVPNGTRWIAFSFPLLIFIGTKQWHHTWREGNRKHIYDPRQTLTTTLTHSAKTEERERLARSRCYRLHILSTRLGGM